MTALTGRAKKLGILFLCVLILMCAGCAKAKTKLEGRIAHVYGGTLLIAGEDGDLYFVAVGGADTGGAKLSAGQTVELEYRGGLKETYPAEITEPEKIMPTGEQSNIIDVYVSIVKEVLKEENAESLAYDFSGTTHMTAAEQQAVGYICWTELDAEPYFGTKEELLEQNILQEKNGTEFLRGGRFITFVADEENPEVLEVSVRINAQTKEEYVYTLAENAGEWTKTLIEAPAEE